MLVKHGADPYIVNEKGLAAAALCKNEPTLIALNILSSASTIKERAKWGLQLS